tara:strand:- start:2390 stop:2647 length:258 start_codon:yes stop_codon:yes gene_type:complete
MEREDLVELAVERLDHLTDQAAAHQRAGNDVEKWICIAEGKDLVRALDKEDDEFFFMTYHRCLSDSFGVEFEIEHGDEELMFGGL